jgi:hypothetical protein
MDVWREEGEPHYNAGEIRLGARVRLREYRFQMGPNCSDLDPALGGNF